MIVLDTSVLSLAFRRTRSLREEPREVARLRELIAQDENLAVPGIVFQEILSGVASPQDFRVLLNALDGFLLVRADRATHLRAARLFTDCRRAGLDVGTIDCLVASHALHRGTSLFTTDADFDGIARVSPLKLYRV